MPSGPMPTAARRKGEAQVAVASRLECAVTCLAWVLCSWQGQEVVSGAPWWPPLLQLAQRCQRGSVIWWWLWRELLAGRSCCSHVPPATPDHGLLPGGSCQWLHCWGLSSLLLPPQGLPPSSEDPMEEREACLPIPEGEANAVYGLQLPSHSPQLPKDTVFCRVVGVLGQTHPWPNFCLWGPGEVKLWRIQATRARQATSIQLEPQEPRSPKACLLLQ